MRFCMSCRQTKDYLLKCDQIKIPYKDREMIIDLVESYPNQSIILDMKQYNGIIDWDEIKKYNILTKNKLYIALNTLTDAELCKNYNIQFYWNYPISTFYELQSLKALGASYALIDAPLTHNVEEAAKIGLPLRLVPNVSYYAFIPRIEGVCGSWVRPEDLDLYESYIDMVEFEDCDIKKEQALFRIYAEQKAWPGDLNMLITNLQYSAINRMIPSDFTKARMKCNQRCMMKNNHCKLCYRYLDLAQPDLLRHLKD